MYEQLKKGVSLLITAAVITFIYFMIRFKCLSTLMIWPCLYIGKWIWPKKVISIDTECVGAGPRGSISMLARVSMVTGDYKVYDKYVKPTKPVTDYRTFVSGIRRANLVNAEDYDKVREEVASRIKGCILVGHDLKNDLDCLDLSHPEEDIRDTSLHYYFKFAYLMSYAEKELSMMKLSPDEDRVGPHHIDEAIRRVKQKHPQIEKPSLRWLARYFLKRNIQISEHSSVEDAFAAMELYHLYEKDFETDHERRRLNSLPKDKYNR